MRALRVLFAMALGGALAGCGVAGNSSSVEDRAGAVLAPADDLLEPGLQGEVPLADQARRASVPAIEQVYGATGPVVPAAAAYRRGLRLMPIQPLRIVDPLTGLARGGNAEIAWLDDCAYMGMGDPLRQALNEQGQKGVTTPLPGTATAPTASSMPVSGYAEVGGDEGNPQPKGCEGGLPTGGDPCNLPDPPADTPQDGLAIISAKNPKQPSLVYTIQLRITPRSPVVGGATPPPPTEARSATATSNPWEALQSNAARREIMVGTANELAMYQAVYNCKYPSRRAIFNLGSFMVHALRIAGDGNTAYLTDQNARGAAGAPLFTAVDASNLREPGVLASYSDTDLGAAGFQNVELSADDRRAYVTYADSGTRDSLTGGNATGLVILDTSEVQARLPNAQIRKIGQLTWTGSAHGVRRAHSGGRDYLLVSESLRGATRCPWGGVRVIDLADEAHPVELAKFGLEVNDAANCNTAMADNATYSASSVSVDDPDNTHYAFFGWANSGLRVFDLGLPATPAEVAYYNPPPFADTINHSGSSAGITLDTTLSSVRFRPESNQLWFASAANGFHVLQFTRSMGPAK